jgi:hypothetical protein
MSSTRRTSAQYPDFTLRRTAAASNTSATSIRRSVARELAHRTSEVKNMAPEMVSASMETLASSNIVIGSSATSTKSRLPNGARRMAKKSRATAASRFPNRAR